MKGRLVYVMWIEIRGRWCMEMFFRNWVLELWDCECGNGHRTEEGCVR